MGRGATLVRRLGEVDLPSSSVAFAWLGQHGFLIRFPEGWLLVDAYLSPSPARRFPPALDPEDVAVVSAVLGSHDHSDHVDRPVWPHLARQAPQAVFIVPARWAGRLTTEIGLPGERVWGIDEGREMGLGRIRIRAIPAAHEFLDRDPVTGSNAWLGFLIEGNGVRLYHAGDTCLYEGLTSRLCAERPDILFLPINGRDAERYRRGCLGNMTYQEAADLAGAVRPRLVVPTHFDMFAGNSENPALFADYMAVKYPSVPVWIPRQGDVYRYPGGPVERMVG